MVIEKCAVCPWVVCHTARPRPGSSVENSLSLSVVFDNRLRVHVVCHLFIGAPGARLNPPFHIHFCCPNTGLQANQISRLPLRVPFSRFAPSKVKFHASFVSTKSPPLLLAIARAYR